jgi:hypothetical protein
MTCNKDILWLEPTMGVDSALQRSLYSIIPAEFGSRVTRRFYEAHKNLETKKPKYNK